MTFTDTPTVPEAVIDTQSLLDWLYFQDPACAGWEAARQAGHWRGVASAAMRAELAHVLGRMFLPHSSAERNAQVLADFDARITVVEAPEPGSVGAPRCRDRDDQKFIELAVARRVRWLVSRDKMVLKLKNRVHTLADVAILNATAWNAALTPPPADAA
jgi:predicted nucleic acid-binding protein